MDGNADQLSFGAARPDADCRGGGVAEGFRKEEMKSSINLLILTPEGVGT
jgi:hypothetical protein